MYHFMFLQEYNEKLFNLSTKRDCFYIFYLSRLSVHFFFRGFDRCRFCYGFLLDFNHKIWVLTEELGFGRKIWVTNAGLGFGP